MTKLVLIAVSEHKSDFRAAIGYRIVNLVLLTVTTSKFNCKIKHLSFIMCGDNVKGKQSIEILFRRLPLTACSSDT